MAAPHLRRCLTAALSTATLALSLAAVPHAAAAAADSGTGSVLGFQCGPAVCLIDPDVPGAAPIQVTPDGTFAGVTADGGTVAWVPPTGGLATAPTAGGAATVVRTDYVGSEPDISPDGTRVLWTDPTPVYIGYYPFYYQYRLDIATGEVVGVVACACASSHGWAGPTPIATFPASGGDDSSICLIGTEEETGTSDSCGSTLVGDPRGALSFPDGSADGQTFVAAMNPDNSEYGGSEGRIALYNRDGHVKDLTTNDTDTTPTLSAEGDRVAFVRDGAILVVDIATGAERVVATGTSPSWGGVRTTGPPIDPVVPNPVVPNPPVVEASAAAVIKGRTARVTRRVVKVRVACQGEGTCVGKVKLRQGRKVYATASYKVRARKTSRVSVRLTKVGVKKFRGDGRVRLVAQLIPRDGASTTKKLKVRF